MSQDKKTIKNEKGENDSFKLNYYYSKRYVNFVNKSNVWNLITK